MPYIPSQSIEHAFFRSLSFLFYLCSAAAYSDEKNHSTEKYRPTLFNFFNLNDNHYFKYQTKVRTGYLTGQFNWNIAADLYGKENPNILSELTYNNLTSSNILLSETLYFKPHYLKDFFIHAEAEYGKIYSGLIQDSDYDGNNKSQEYSRSFSDPKGSEIKNFLGSVGGIITETGIHKLSIEGGVSLNQQHFQKKNGVQVLSTSLRTADNGAFSGLNSTYNANWLSGFLGLEETLKFRKDSVKLGARFFWSDYQAIADWNLRRDFAHPRSFQHDATGKGICLNVSYLYPLFKQFLLQLSAEKSRFVTNSGTDTVFFKNGGVGVTKLNEVNWESMNYSFGVSYLFE